jgi:antitoxin (DNA-binding transcriptional repressor) of toxin-antitoxin stability system
MNPITMADLRRDLARVVNSVALGNERVIVERHASAIPQAADRRQPRRVPHLV